MPKDYHLDYENDRGYFDAQGQLPGGPTSGNQTLATIGLVAGIIGFVTFFCPPLPILLGVVGISCGLLAKPRGPLALASLVVGILSVILPLLIMGVFMANWGYLFLQQLG